MTPSSQFLSILLLALTVTPLASASHARGGHLTNAQAFAAGVLDGFKALPLPPPSFISTTFENSPGQLRMVPSGKKGKRHGHGGQAVLAKSNRGIIRITRSDGPTSYLSRSLNNENEYTLTSNPTRAARITLPSACPIGGFAVLAPTNEVPMSPFLGIDSREEVLGLGSAGFGVLVPSALASTGSISSVVWSMPNCDTHTLEISTPATEFNNPIPLSLIDHDGNIGVVGNWKLYNRHHKDTVLPLTFTFVSTS